MPPTETPGLRQRLLYLHAATPNVFSHILAHMTIEPVAGYKVELTADPEPCPYNSVQEAMVDGWQVIQLPDPQAPFDDREIDLIGYQFVLQKTAVFDV